MCGSLIREVVLLVMIVLLQSVILLVLVAQTHRLRRTVRAQRLTPATGSFSDTLGRH